MSGNKDQKKKDVTLFVCENEKDNVPQKWAFEGEHGEEVAFSVSQNRINGKKKGQDAIAACIEGDRECVVLCDGHDVHGDIVARRIVEVLAEAILGNLEGVDLRSKQATEAILCAFNETDDDVLWSNENIQANSFCRVISGEFEGMVGYVSDEHLEDAAFSVIIIDQNSYHKPRLQRNQIECAKYTGGSTCVAFVRDAKENIARIAVMGDTRCLLLNSKDKNVKSDEIFEQVKPNTFLSYPHDVFNTAELNRIKSTVDEDDYEIEGPYLINPLTSCEIQPTRGFGDFDLYGCGYISTPDISHPFKLSEDTLVLIGSDGIFDPQVWDFKELISRAEELNKDSSLDLETVAEKLHAETIKKSLEGGYVDDISLFLCRISSKKINEKKPAVTTAKPRKKSFVNKLKSNVRRKSRSNSPMTRLTRSNTHGSSNSKNGNEIIKPAVKAKAKSRLRSATTSDYITDGRPRYLSKEREALQLGGENKLVFDTIRRSRGPSYMLPDGLNSESSKKILGKDGVDTINTQIETRTSNLLSISELHINVDNGGGSKANSLASPMKKSLASESIKEEQDGLNEDDNDQQVNIILRKIAKKFGHDLKKLDQLLTDLEVV